MELISRKQRVSIHLNSRPLTAAAGALQPGQGYGRSPRPRTKQIRETGEQRGHLSTGITPRRMRPQSHHGDFDPDQSEGSGTLRRRCSNEIDVQDLSTSLSVSPSLSPDPDPKRLRPKTTHHLGHIHAPDMRRGSSLSRLSVESGSCLDDPDESPSVRTSRAVGAGMAKKLGRWKMNAVKKVAGETDAEMDAETGHRRLTPKRKFQTRVLVLLALVALFWKMRRLCSSRWTNRKRAASDADSRDHFLEPLVPLLFDPSLYKANTQMRMSTEAKQILRSDPDNRSKRDIHYTIIALRGVSTIADFPLRMQERLATYGHFECYDPGRVIVKQDHPPLSFYFILYGIVRVAVRNNKTEEENIVCYLERGQTFGELSIIARSVRQATIVTKTYAELLSIDVQTYEKIFMVGGSRNIHDPDHQQFIESLFFLKGWPLARLQDDPRTLVFSYFRRGAVIAKDSRYSKWIFIVKSGSVSVMKRLADQPPTVAGGTGRLLPSHPARQPSSVIKLTAFLNEIERRRRRTQGLQGSDPSSGHDGARQAPQPRGSLSNKIEYERSEPPSRAECDKLDVSKKVIGDSATIAEEASEADPTSDEASPVTVKTDDAGNVEENSPTDSSSSGGISLAECESGFSSDSDNTQSTDDVRFNIHSIDGSVSSDNGSEHSDRSPKNGNHETGVPPTDRNFATGNITSPRTGEADATSSDIRKSATIAKDARCQANTNSESPPSGRKPKAGNHPNELYPSGRKLVRPTAQNPNCKYSPKSALRRTHHNATLRKSGGDNSSTSHKDSSIADKRAKYASKSRVSWSDLVGPNKTAVVQTGVEHAGTLNLSSAEAENMDELNSSYQIPKHMRGRKRNSVCSGRRTMVDELDSVPSGPKDESDAASEVHPVFVCVQTLTKGDVFGLASLVFKGQPTLSLVSNGAECILISRDVYLQHCPNHLLHRLENEVSPYPSDGTLQSNLMTWVNWGVYKRALVQQCKVQQRMLSV